MKKQSYPFEVGLYKGRGRIWIVAELKHSSGCSIDSDWFVSMDALEDYGAIGEGVLFFLEK